MKPTLLLDLTPPTVLIDGVQYTYPIFSKGRVNRAAALLAKTPDWNQLQIFDDIEDARKSVNNWRSAHSYPLNSVKMTLKQRAVTVDKLAIVYQRLKRSEAIKAKMLRQKKEHGRMFDLTSMQDLGGCRAIMSDIEKIEELLGVYEDAHKKNPDRGSMRESMDDYISRPKDDGYRGIHLIYKYRSQAEERENGLVKDWDRSKFDGLRIEIQIRSLLQHQWASAVETAGRRAKMNIKSEGGGRKWDSFFRLTSSAIAMIENRPLVPDTPNDREELIKEIQKHEDLLRLLKAYTVPHISVPGVKHGEMFVLVVDPVSQEVKARPFHRRHLQDAQEDYFLTEKTIQSQESVEAVLVGVDSEDQLPIAYPSYFLDARGFVKIIDKFIARGAWRSREQEGLPFRWDLVLAESRSAFPELFLPNNQLRNAGGGDPAQTL